MYNQFNQRILLPRTLSDAIECWCCFVSCHLSVCPHGYFGEKCAQSCQGCDDCHFETGQCRCDLGSLGKTCERSKPRVLPHSSTHFHPYQIRSSQRPKASMANQRVFQPTHPANSVILHKSGVHVVHLVITVAVVAVCCPLQIHPLFQISSQTSQYRLDNSQLNGQFR